jgi:hypothetical protein
MGHEVVSYPIYPFQPPLTMSVQIHTEIPLTYRHTHAQICIYRILYPLAFSATKGIMFPLWLQIIAYLNCHVVIQTNFPNRTFQKFTYKNINQNVQTLDLPIIPQWLWQHSAPRSANHLMVATALNFALKSKINLDKMFCLYVSFVCTFTTLLVQSYCPFQCNNFEDALSTTVHCSCIDLTSDWAQNHLHQISQHFQHWSKSKHHKLFPNREIWGVMNQVLHVATSFPPQSEGCLSIKNSHLLVHQLIDPTLLAFTIVPHHISICD